MRSRPKIWILLCLLCLAGAWFFWQQPANTQTKPSALQKVAVPSAFAPLQRDKTVRPYLPSTAPNILAATSTNSATSAKTNQFAYRLSNTTKTIGQLVGDRHAILLENALIDTASPLNFSIPKHLQSQGDPGAYIVQARGPIGAAFRAMLARSGAQIVSYIPNDAYLVRAPAGVANGLTGNPLTQAVIPYEPYYKISSSMPVTIGQKTVSSAPTETNRAAGPSLLELAVKQAPMPAGTCLTLGLFKDNAAATVAQIEKLGGEIVARDNSPFGPIVRVQPPVDWVALATLPGVQIVEPYRQRVHANDLSRATVGVASDTLVPINYMGLTGLNVLVEVNDFGIDATHPDLAGRVFGSPITDPSGHGTHVAGIIAGDGTESMTVTNASGSIIATMPGPTATNLQFRGKARLANLLSMDLSANTDQELQEAAALTNALISNNSWNYDGDNVYDLNAASYDAAVRDALPSVTGSQPVLFVFSAGNSGGSADDNGFGGHPNTILSPATAKNVISVGALEQFRNITNQVTNANGTVSTPWKPMTDTSFQVAGYSSRGNVGIGIEGGNGRFKPDVVAPGNFVLSTRSEEWDELAYYNPTNFNFTVKAAQLVSPGSQKFYSLFVPSNAVQVTIQLFPNIMSPFPFPDLPILLWKGKDPRVSPPDLIGTGSISIPPDSTLAPVGVGWSYAVSNNTSAAVSYDLAVDTITTNANGNKFQVLSNLNDSIGMLDSHNKYPYRYETGTSMSAADVSGVLALMQDYFTNLLQAPLPSPALLKAMLINGARSADSHYGFEVQNAINFQGWGLINLPNSLPPGITNQLTAACASFYVDQSPTNALATGDSHTYMVTVDANTDAQYLPLQVTLTWTDPPGDPAAAIKLVNNLDLVVTNLDDPANPIIYYGNDIESGNTVNTPRDTNSPPNFDSINNVENVIISPLLGTKYSITIIGRSVNVNAVTAHTNNVVQDYALVISCGEGEVTNAFTVTDNGIVSNPTGDQQITYVVTTNAPLMNQLAGASTPLLGTNTIQLANNTELNGIQLSGTNIVTLGMTNQWHFYVVTNTGAADFTNAAFITFIPDTLSIPRMGVFANSQANATRPEADIDLYVSTNSALMNLAPAVISSADKSVGRGGTEFVYYTNSAPGKVYYVGVYSEDQEAAQYGFMPIFTDVPFSQMNSNGDQVVNGQLLQVNIPDGSPAHPGSAYVFALATYPMEIQRVVVTGVIPHNNFGDLIGGLAHGQQNGLSDTVVLNNHDSLGNTFGPPPRTFIYDDSGQNNIFGTQPSDSPGSLNGYIGQQGVGPWILTEVDNSLTQTGAVAGFNLLIQPHQNLSKGLTGTVGPMGWWYGYIDVPSGTASLTISATNITPAPSLTPPLELYVKVGSIPTLTDTNEFGPVGLTNPPVPPPKPGNSITINSPAPGRYWVGLYNGSVVQQNFYIIANLGVVTPPAQVIFSSAGPVPILDDAVTTDSILVTRNEAISSVDVALRVDHPRVSDLVFHLISPDGTRVLLVENRGGTTTNGMGATLAVTKITPATSTGDGSPSTNVINTGSTAGTAQISYNFYSVPDELVVQYQGTNIFDSGIISGSGVFPVAYGPGTNTQLTIIMNPTVNPGPGDLWDYTVNSAQVTSTYLVLTEDTNKTTTPIKFAPPPFVPGITYSIPSVPTNIPTLGQPILNPANGHSYYLLANTNWTASEAWAIALGGHLATINDVVEDNWVLNTFSRFKGTDRNLWIGFYDAGKTNNTQASSYVWANGEPVTYMNWLPGEPNLPATDFYVYMYGLFYGGIAGQWNNCANVITNITQIVLNGVAEVAPTPSGPDLYYLPEVSLDLLQGENAQGQWQLEIQDDRAGAGLTNTLVSWQLRFNFPTANGSIGTITNGMPQTNTIPAGGIAYYFVNVPVNADIATNILISPNGPLNLWFNPTTPPSGTNSTGDVLLLSGTFSGTAILYTNGAPPNLVPGGSYYLAVQNTNTFTVTNYSIEVDFHLIPVPIVLINGLPQTNSITGGGIDYYLVTVPTNADWATNLLLFAGGPLNVWFNPTNLPVLINPPDVLLIGGATNGISIFGTNSIPTNIVPGGTYYLAVQNPGTSNVTYGIVVNFHLQAPSVPAGGVAYYLINVPTNADFATNILLFATAPLNIWFTTNSPPSITNANDVRLLPDATYQSGTNGSVVLSAGTAPPLVPGGTYYLGVQNTNIVGVFFGLEVDFHLLSTNNVNATNTIFITSITHTNIGGTNGFLLTWFAPSNDLFQVQWTGSLAPASWSTFTNIISYNTNAFTSPTNTQFNFFDDGSQTGGFGPMRFYRLVRLGSGFTNGVPQTNSVSPGSTAFLLVSVPATATSANNTLISATGPVNVWFNQTHLPTGNTNTGDFLELAAATAGSFLLDGSSVPPLVPGATYYLGVQNPGTTNVTFDFQVTFGFTPPVAVANFSVTATNGGIWLKWNGQTNYQYQVQWTTNLAPPTAWNTISNIVLTSTTGVFTFFDDGSLTGGLGRMKFYRLIAWPFMTPIPQTLFISSVTLTNLAGTNDLVLRWSAPTNYQYGIQWTTNLALPYSNWFIITNPPPALANGVYTFIDNGLTGPPGSAKFFRIFDYP